MAEVLMSEAERTFILHGIQDNVRSDGRGCEDYRPIELETEVVSNANGSARVRLANSDVLVGVKGELGKPSLDTPEHGRLEFFVDCSANATPDFEGRGGEDLALEISSMLARAYDCPSCLDTQALGIIKREQCWVLYVDILILECGGNLFDAVAIAVKAALGNTKLPVITVRKDENDETELEISDDPYDCERIKILNAPCIVTLGKVGNQHIVDASLQEESCCLSRLMVAVTESGTITASKTSGSGSLNPESIIDMLESGKRAGTLLNKTLHAKLLEEEVKVGTKKKTMGFLT